MASISETVPTRRQVEDQVRLQKDVPTPMKTVFSSEQRRMIRFGLSLLTTAAEALGERAHVSEIAQYVRENPIEALGLLSGLDQAIQGINIDVTYGRIHPLARDTQAIALEVLPLPLIFSDYAGIPRQRFLDAYQRALLRENTYMAVREEVEHATNLDPEIYASNHWIEGHIRGKTPRAKFVGLMIHAYDLMLTELSEFVSIGYENIINPICQSAAVHLRGSQFFNILYSPDELDWFASGYGLSDEFIQETTDNINRDVIGRTIDHVYHLPRLKNV